MSFAETSTMYKTPGNRGEFEAPLGSESSAYPDRRTRVDSFSAQGVNVDKSDLVSKEALAAMRHAETAHPSYVSNERIIASRVAAFRSMAERGEIQV